MTNLLNVKTWGELKKALRKIQGKAIFELTRVNSLNDGVFVRVLHQVKPHQLVFFDGKQLVSLDISTEVEQNIEFFENGFKFLNCIYILKLIVEGNNQ